jgi:hypothetical protein
MKKFAVLALAALLVVAFTLPAAAEVENTFGGYWRTRAFFENNFSGEKDAGPNGDQTIVDTRTRLYYTAGINENLKLVNKFEFDATWGAAPNADIGTDGVALEIKNTYAEITRNGLTARVGLQGLVFQRGFLFDDDAAAVLLMQQAGNITWIGAWVKFFEGDRAFHDDVDVYGIAPFIQINEQMSIQPYLVYAYSGDANAYLEFLGDAAGTTVELGVYYIGVDFDHKTDAFAWWFTGIYEGGTLKTPLVPAPDTDVKAWLAAAGGNWNFGTGDIHAQIFSATGQGATATDLEAFSVFQGQSWYWSEIMGLGTFDNQASAGAPGNIISNILAAGAGVTFKPMDKMSLTVDVWYAKLNEAVLNTAGVLADDLGTEVDAKLSYSVIEGLNIDLILAWLSAGKATGDGTEDPIEGGVQMSLSF